MSKYGEVPSGQSLVAQFLAKKMGHYRFELYPELWAVPKLAEYYKDRTWTVTPFTDPPPINIPTSSGIYMFVVAPHCGKLEDHSYIFYVGQATNLYTRYRQYLSEQKGESSNPREEVVIFLNHLRDHVFFHFTQVPKDELDEAEDLLKDNLTPPANKQKTIVGRLAPPNSP
jgi:hypothetical protein